MRFEFEDSEVAEIRRLGDALLIRFSAARLYEGDGRGAGAGWWQPALLICKQVVQIGPGLDAVLAAAGRLQQARLQLAGQSLRRLPMPFASDAGFALELEFAAGPSCSLQGQGLELSSPDAQCAVESFQC
ncbi:hypothetical protein [Comamonas guangdongensis]|uniref:Uncharacterized protein n=1 Tax=Comamonas guangdongensis TaxID=510515 RepID=A0ABV3ZQY0_9BURK